MKQSLRLTKCLYLKAFLAFALGILLLDNLSIETALITPIILCLGFLFFFHLQHRLAKKWIDAFVFIAILYAGIGFHYWNHTYSQSDILSKIAPYESSKHIILLRVDEKPIEKAKTYQIACKLITIYDSLNPIPIHANTLVYIAKPDSIPSFSYGQYIAIRSQVQRPIPAHYPFEFDYAEWLERKKIYTTLYATDYTVVGEDSSLWYSISVFPKQIRDYCAHILDMTIEGARANITAKSLLLGIRSEMDSDLLEAYSNTGTIHILSVSGLHFAILFLFLNWILKKIGMLSKPKFYLVHSVSLLYALMTGFSPPVMRSFLMFLLLDIEKTSKINRSPLNILFLSAWLILLWNTNQLFDIGYQLSYMAILGIMLWQHRLERLIAIDGYILNWIWKSTCTLIAATIFTMPFILYYFHKISGLGLLSNYLVIPITTAVMYLGFVDFLLSFLPWIPDVLGKIIEYLILFQNTIIQWFSHIPGAYLDDIYFSKNLLICSLAGLFLWNIFLYHRSRVHFRWLLLIIGIFSLCRTIEIQNIQRKQEWILFPSKRHAGFAYLHHSRLHIFSDSIESRISAYFLPRLYTYYHISESHRIRHGLYDRIADQPMRWSPAIENHPQYLMLIRENRKQWKDAIVQRDSFLLCPSLGHYYQQNALTLLHQHQKHYIIP